MKDRMHQVLQEGRVSPPELHQVNRCDLWGCDTVWEPEPLEDAAALEQGPHWQGVVAHGQGVAQVIRGPLPAITFTIKDRESMERHRKRPVTDRESDVTDSVTTSPAATPHHHVALRKVGISAASLASTPAHMYRETFGTHGGDMWGQRGTPQVLNAQP
jgi:hypothetical protein